MQEEKKQLELLQEKILSTWDLLHIDDLIDEQQSLQQKMEVAGFWSNQEDATRVSKRESEIQEEVQTWKKMQTDTNELLALIADLEKQRDESLQQEVKKQTEELNKQFEHLEFYLLMNGKHDQNNAIVAVHAGSGGTEAQDWAEMLRRMVFRYCEKKGWKTIILDESMGQEAGIKSCVFRVEGRFAYGHLQSEHGTHRLVRLSPFNADALRQTSFALIEVIPEVETTEMNFDPKDLRIDTFMAGGKGGQSVNTTYSAVRIVHIPTGITVQCQNERSQLQNRESALKVLHSKLQKLQEEQNEKERLELRGEYKSAQWGNQIRSYVLHPYKMVKDLRTRYETKNPDDVLGGNLDPLVEEYLRWKKDGMPNRKNFDDEND